MEGLCYPWKRNLIGVLFSITLVLLLRRIRCCYSFFSFYNWVSYVSTALLCFFSFLEFTVIVNSLYIWSLTFLFFGVCVWYFLRVFCFCGSSSGVLGLCIWVLYYVCSFISGLLFVLFCWYSCWAVLFFDCNSHLTFVSF